MSVRLADYYYPTDNATEMPQSISFWPLAEPRSPQTQTLRSSRPMPPHDPMKAALKTVSVLGLGFQAVGRLDFQGPRSYQSLQFRWQSDLTFSRGRILNAAGH